MRKIIKESEVCSDVRTAAEAALLVAEKQLGIGPISIVWEDLEAKGMWGQFMPARPDEIVIDPTSPEVADTVLHESFHAKQYQDGNHVPSMFDPYDLSGREREAIEFARKYTPVVQEVIPVLVEKAAALGKAQERLQRLQAVTSEPCTCDSIVKAAEKLAGVPSPFRNRVVPLKALVAWEEAVLSDDRPAIKAMSSDGWLTELILKERAKYERSVCSQPQHSNLPFCQEADTAELRSLLEGIRAARREVSYAR